MPSLRLFTIPAWQALDIVRSRKLTLTTSWPTNFVGRAPADSRSTYPAVSRVRRERRRPDAAMTSANR